MYGPSTQLYPTFYKKDDCLQWEVIAPNVLQEGLNPTVYSSLREVILGVLIVLNVLQD